MSVVKLLRTANRVPFSHKNGVRTILPETPFVLELFHTAMRIYRFDEQTPIREVVFPELGLVEKWVAFFDYEHRLVTVEGRSAGVFFRYSVRASFDGVYLLTLKQPLAVSIDAAIHTLPVKVPFLLVQEQIAFPTAPRPFLSLGCNKSPLIERMRDHPAMDEIIPLVYHQATAMKLVLPRVGGAVNFEKKSVLERLVDTIEMGHRHEVLELMGQFWTMALEDNCVPKRRDNAFFGYKGTFVPDDVVLQNVLPVIAFAIRSMFIQEKPACSGIYLLPCLPKEFLAGRLLDEVVERGHRIHFEWRRGVVRRVLLDAFIDDEIRIHTGASSCSIRCCSLKNKKCDQNLSDMVAIKGGCRYLLDNFM